LLSSVQLPPNQAGAAQGDTVTLLGQSLTGFNGIKLTNQRFGFVYQPYINPSAVSATSVTFSVPNDPTNLPAGVYNVSALLTDGTGNIIQSTNSLALGIAPTIVMSPAPTATNGASGTTVTLKCTPDAQVRQIISLAMGGSAVPAQPFPPLVTITPDLSFLFPAPGLASGPYVIRLQVDGVESAVKWTAGPPAKFISPIVTVL